MLPLYHISPLFSSFFNKNRPLTWVCQRSEALAELVNYFQNNWDSIVERLNGAHPGSCTEPLISHVLSERLSRTPLAWSREGLGKMAMLRIFVQNGGKVTADHIRVSRSKKERAKDHNARRNGLEIYSKYAEKQVEEAIGGNHDWSIFENERTSPALTYISERAEEIERRNDFGHWELDTVVGKTRTKAALLVLTERKTRYELIYKLENKTQDAVIAALNRLERKIGVNRFRKVFKTITCDNGCENLDHEGMERSIKGGKRTNVYYAHPYSAWERGSNENANKLIRRFIPKGSDIGRFTRKEIKRIQRWMNDYPRAIIDGLSAKMAVLVLGQEPADA